MFWSKPRSRSHPGSTINPYCSNAAGRNHTGIPFPSVFPTGLKQDSTAKPFLSERSDSGVLADFVFENRLQTMGGDPQPQNRAEEPPIARMVVKLGRFIAKIAPATQFPDPADKIKVRRIIIGIQPAQPEKWPRLPVEAAPQEVRFEILKGDTMPFAVEFSEGFQGRAINEQEKYR